MIKEIANLYNADAPCRRRQMALKTVLTGAFLCTTAVQAFAQTDDQGQGDGIFAETILVTARKKEQNLQEVGVAVTSFSGQQVETLNWQTSVDISAQTPGLTSTSTAGDPLNFSIFSIRGVSQMDFAEGQEAPVALYRDEAYISSPGASGIPLYDLDRVEILRGPQGTLYGRNATGGLVHFISNRPTEEFEFKTLLTVAEFGRFGAEGAVSGSITDTVRGRLAYYYNRDDGYISNALGPDYRADNTYSLRGSVDFDIADGIELLLIGSYTDVNTRGATFNTVASKPDPETGLSVLCQPFDTDCGTFNPNLVEDAQNGVAGLFSGTGIFDVANGFIDDGDGDIFSGSFDFAQSGNARETASGTAIFKMDLADGITLTSVTDYSIADKVWDEESDGVGANLFVYGTTANIDQISQEIRVNGTTDRFDWIVGGYFLDISNEFTGLFAFPGDGYFPQFAADQNTQTLSLFGQVDVRLTDTLTFIGGARWTQDDKDILYQFVQCDVTSPNALGFCPARLISDPVLAADPFSDNANFDGFLVDGTPYSFDRKDTMFSGTAQLDWQITPDHLVYAGWSRGVKGGGFNTPLDGFDPADISAVGYDPEVLNSFETGFKSTLLDGALRINGTAFYYDYKNFQAFFFADTTSRLVNTDAEFFGGELEVYYSPGDGWDFVGGIALLDTSVNGSAGGSVIDDQEAPLAPPVTVNALLRKEWEMESGYSVAAQLSGNYVARNFFNIINSQAVRAGDYTLFNAVVSLLSPDERWEFSVFSNNFTNTEALNFGYDITGFGFNTIQIFGPPRWSGARIRFTL